MRRNILPRVGVAIAVMTTVVIRAPHVLAAANEIIVNTTNAYFEDVPGNCALYEALWAMQSQTTVDRCIYSAEKDTIVVPAGRFNVIENGVYVGNGVTVRGAGVRRTILYSNGAIAPLVVTIEGGTLKDLSVQGLAPLSQLTTGVMVSGIVESALENVRVYGFNNSGVITNGNLKITNSTINNNSSPERGGGVMNIGGHLTVLKSTVSRNSAPAGGGIDVSYGRVELEYSTIANNTATAGKGGGIRVYADSYGYAECDGLHTTVAFNSATDGGGGVFMGAPGTVAGSSSTSTKWNASIIAKNTRSGGTPDDFVGTMRGSMLGPQDGLNKNLVGVLSNPPPIGWNPSWARSVGDFVADPRFSGALAPNGGPTYTIALQTTSPRSPAIDAGTNNSYDLTMRGFDTDQRGTGQDSVLFSAPVGSRYDLGAFEAR